MSTSKYHQSSPYGINRLNLQWIIRMRIVAIIGQTIVICVASLLLQMRFPLAILSLILALEAFSNLVLVIWSRRVHNIKEWTVGLVLILDVLFLSALLYWTGGSYNPFSLLYFLHIALAALVLRSVWTWPITLFCIGCYGFLFSVHSKHHLPWVSYETFTAVELQGMWVAFSVTAGVLAFFINKIQQALMRRDGEINQMRVAQMRSEKLASLATLAAGAAHEFSTPLSTIAVVAGELERGLTREEARESFVQDVQLIRDQVHRCREILMQMSADAGESLGEIAVKASPGEIFRETLSQVKYPERVHVVDQTSSVFVPVVDVPLRAFAQALRGIVNNALDASQDSLPVHLEATVEDHRRELIIEVRDQGVGIADDVLGRIGEPFFTTKPPGKGMGLGVFLARTLVEKIGGTFYIDSDLDRGTCVRITVPCVDGDEFESSRDGIVRAAQPRE